MNTSGQLLRRAFIANWLFSIGSGILFVLAAAPIATFMGVGQPLVITLLGFGIILFGAVVLRESRRSTLSASTGYTIFALDALWVVGSIVLLVTDAFSLTTGARWAILIISDIVLVLAILEFLGARQISASLQNLVKA